MGNVKIRPRMIILAVYLAVVALTPATSHADDRLYGGQMLARGAGLASSNGQYTLTMQLDGNLVLYDSGNRPLWASNTDGMAVQKCSMQNDGNLVLYLFDGRPAWASNTNGKAGAFLWLQNDGNLVIYHNRIAVWASNTAR